MSRSDAERATATPQLWRADKSRQSSTITSESAAPVSEGQEK